MNYDSPETVPTRRLPVSEQVDPIAQLEQRVGIEEQLDQLSNKLRTALREYLLRPNSDSSVLGLMDDVVGKLDHSLHFGDNNEPLGNEPLLDVKAALIGARMVLTPNRDRIAPEVESVHNTGLARRFLELSQSRVGTFNPTSGEASLHMRISPEQREWTVKNHKKQ